MATVKVSERASEMLRQIRRKRSGVLTITIDGGCCEGTAPHLYEDYVVPSGSVEIGRAEDIPIYIAPHFQDQYKRARVTIDLIDDESSDAMSIETEHGVRLVMRTG